MFEAWVSHNNSERLVVFILSIMLILRSHMMLPPHSSAPCKMSMSGGDFTNRMILWASEEMFTNIMWSIQQLQKSYAMVTIRPPYGSLKGANPLRCANKNLKSPHGYCVLQCGHCSVMAILGSYICHQHATGHL